jgi:hypothetical protein
MEVTNELKQKVFDKPNIGGDNIYDYILRIFVGDDEYRPWINNPFYINELAFSTDSHLMVFFDKNLATDIKPIDDKQNAKVMDVINIPRDLEFTIPIEKLKENLLLCEFIPEKRRTGKYVNCDVCGGEGEVEWEFHHNSQSFNRDFDCPVCDGSGHSEEPITSPTGNATFEQYQRALIYKSHLDCRYLHKLHQLANLLNATEVTLISQAGPNKPSLFKIGDVSLIIMPMIFDEKEPIVFKINH